MGKNLSMSRNLQARSTQVAGSLLMKCAILLSAVLGASSLVATSVYATLTSKARTTVPQSVSTGTLSLTMNPGISVGTTDGFLAPIRNMAAGDGVTRFVDIKFLGTLPAASLYLVGSASETPTALLTDASYGLTVKVEECSSIYPSNGSCGATVFNSLSTTSYASALGRFKINTSTLANSATIHLKVSFRLPVGNEYVQDGSLPVGTLQGLTQNMTWSFVETVVNGTSIS